MSPDGPAQVSQRVGRLVPGDGPGSGWFPGLDVLARRDDSMGHAGGSRVVAFARIAGPLGGY